MTNNLSQTNQNENSSPLLANGLSSETAHKKLIEFGANIFYEHRPPSWFKIFFRQFHNPLIYILLIAAGIAIALGDMNDAFFIGLVVLINAIIGFFQEFNAEKNAKALTEMTPPTTRVLRDSQIKFIKSSLLVPGDIIILESGDRVPADAFITECYNLEVNESLLTGESLPVKKLSRGPAVNTLSELFAGTTITKGRARACVTKTGLNSELGKIADSLSQDNSAKPPLIQRFELLTKKISIFFVGASVLMATYLIYFKGQEWSEVLMLTIALAVSAIPEGLPIAMTVALAVAANKMSKRNVIVRKLPAVEALGSCTYIATDKTGTLTVNQLTIKKILLADASSMDIAGSGYTFPPINQGDIENFKKLETLSQAGFLCNEATLNINDDVLTGIGDAVDIAFLVLEHKVKSGLSLPSKSYTLLDQIPFDAENQYAATLHHSSDNHYIVTVKGAFEKVANFLDTNHQTDWIKPIENLAEQGYRVLSIAQKVFQEKPLNIKDSLKDMQYLGTVGMIDPLRPEAQEAIKISKQAGIEIAMITGDHPKTAFAIAKQIGLLSNPEQVLTGTDLVNAKSDLELRNLIRKGRVFARINPNQKLMIVESLIQDGHFVAVTGDGANDAPALKAANVGIAMGKTGTDIAKDSADLILTDDRFASIQSGIEEGRIAYSNIRKVVYLLISTGLAEIILFILSFIFNTPLPLTAVQVLWLNLVTNGIQDKGLAFEPSEGDELLQKPRSPKEPIFNKIMLSRILLSATIMGCIGFAYFYYQIESELPLTDARNQLLLLMVLFENMMIINAKSEQKSAFKINFLNNYPLLFAVLIAQGIHILAMYTPGLNTILNINPVKPTQWAYMLIIASSIVLGMEIFKYFNKNKSNGS